MQSTTNYSSPSSTPSTRRPWLRTLVLAVVLAVLASACGSSAVLEGEPQAAVAEPISFERVDATPRPDYDSDYEVAPEIELEGDLGFTPADTTTVTPNENGTTTIVGTIDVPTTAGPVPIEDAEVIVEVDPVTGESKIIGGIGTIPFPRVGELADAVINHLPEGIIGVALGRDLHHLGAHLVDDREYIYFHFDGGLDIDLPIAGQPGFEALPSKIKVPTGKSATFVLDPTDPYFYIGGACPQSNKESNDNNDKNDNNEDARKRDDDANQDDEPSDALYTIPAADLPPGEDCGFGFSLNGNIPAPATADGDTFSGHIVLDGIVPLYAGLELDGSTVFSFDRGVRAVGWGHVLTAVPLVPELIDIQIPLGNASVEFQADGTRVGMAIEGTVGGPEEIVLPLDIPVTLPSTNQIDFSANYGLLIGADGTVTFDPDSYVDISGAANMGLGDFGRLIDLDLSNIVTQEMSLRIDVSGARIVGVTNAEIHPSIETDGAIEFEAFLSATNPAASYFTYNADIRVFGTDLAAATIDLSRRGLFVSGTVNTGGLTVEVSGQISKAGADISGTTSLEVNLDAITDAAQDSAAALDDAIAEVERLDAAIDAAREQVRTERRERDQGFIDARNVVEAAKGELDVINRNIAKNDRRIADLRKAHANEIKRYNRLNFAEKGLQLVSRNAKLTGYDAEIVALQAANVTQKGLKPAAQAALTAAQDVLRGIEAALNILPVDTDPRIVTLFATRDTAVATLTALRSGAELIDVGGVVRGELHVTVGTTGLGGSFTGEVCQTGGVNCSTLAGGRVEFFPTPTLCVELFGLGEHCLPI